MRAHVIGSSNGPENVLQAVTDLRKWDQVRDGFVNPLFPVRETGGHRVVDKPPHLRVTHYVFQQVLVGFGALLGHHGERCKANLVVSIQCCQGQKDAVPCPFQRGPVQAKGLCMVAEQAQSKHQLCKWGRLQK